MKKTILLNKKEGETPLQALEVFRRKNKEYKDIPMTYAGRLDPMASGVLLVLAGEETKNKEKYLNLDKKYEFEVLFGFATDTYDILGKVVSKQGASVDKKELEKNIKNSIKSFKGHITQQYPMYSSKTVDGKPLFAYAREGASVEAPQREVTIKSLKFKTLKSINSRKLEKDIEKRINKVEGDFRQKEILQIWHKNLAKIENGTFYIASFDTTCSTGTYVRTIANSLGGMIKVPALAYSIKRTKLGKWKLME